MSDEIVVVAQRMWQRRGYAALWTSVNPIMEAGEIGVELQSVGVLVKFKIGDGVTDWNSLDYFSGGADVSMRVDSGYIQFSGDDGTTWTNVIDVASLTGADGVSPEMRVDSGYIQYSIDHGANWVNIISTASLEGPDGVTPILQSDSGYIQYSIDSGATWTNLVSLSSLTGPAGADAPTVARVTATITGSGTSQILDVIAMGKVNRILKIAASSPCRLRLYATTAARDADAARLVSAFPTAYAGLIGEWVFDASHLTLLCGPIVHGANMEATPLSQLAYALDPTLSSTTCTLTYQAVEA